MRSMASRRIATHTSARCHPSRRRFAAPQDEDVYAETQQQSQSEIRLPYIRIAPDLRRRALHLQTPGLQDVGTVGDLKTLGDSLLDDQHRHPGVADLLDGLKNLVDQLGHDALRRL